MSAWVSGFREVRRDTAPRPVRRSHGLLTTAVVALLAIFGVSQLHNLLPSIHNPFTTTTVDRSGPVLLKSLTDLHTYSAAQGTYSEFVDLKKEHAYIPSFLAGEDKKFLAVGAVEAGVDFSGLDASSMVISKDHKSISINLPAATLGAASLDMDNSKVIGDSKGAADRLGSLLGSSGDDSKVYAAGQDKITAAAAADSSLITKAETNTRAMLTTLLASLGFTSVSVSFA